MSIFNRNKPRTPKVYPSDKFNFIDKSGSLREAEEGELYWNTERRWENWKFKKVEILYQFQDDQWVEIIDPEFTIAPPDDSNYAHVLMNGYKTGTRILCFSEKRIKELQKIKI